VCSQFSLAPRETGPETFLFVGVGKKKKSEEKAKK
jgi:hypothetical protein